jgi:hypothetical protein
MRRLPKWDRFRLDRLLTLLLFQLSSKINRWKHSPALPILMYHSISDDPETGVLPYYRVCTSPQRFAEQMHFLKETGWQAVNLSTGLEWLSCSGSESRCSTTATRKKVVALTFDDGYRDFYTAAFTVLSKLRFSATMYQGARMSYVG